jgi:hypothetical protein
MTDDSLGFYLQVTAIGVCLLGPANLIVICMGVGLLNGLWWERVLTFDLLIADALFLYYA